MIRRDVLRLALAGVGLGLPASGAAQSRACLTPHPSTCRAGAGSICSTSSWPIVRSPSRNAILQTSPSWASTSPACPWITAAGPNARIPKVLNEPVLKEIDQAVELGRKHGVHVQINFHRAPGYTVAKPAEPKSLWTDSEILEICAHQWATFAAQYRGIPNNRVSFNLINEPGDAVKPEDYRRVVERIAGAVRERDPERLIVCDGRAYATKPPTELLGLNVAASLHDYIPMPLTHYKASWVNWDESWPEPTWPLTQNDGKVIGRGTIVRELIKPWKEFETKGVGVMVGEFGAHNLSPHRFVLSWMHDTLEEFKKAGWGWALWNFTGSFGICDSGRYDVAFENWHGRKLDRGMLDLLQNG